MPKIRCECNRVLAYREDQAGKRVKCPACSAKIILPGIAPAPDASAPIITPRKEVPLAPQPGRAAPAHIMPNKPLKLEPTDEGIPIAGDVPDWGSEPHPDAPEPIITPRKEAPLAPQPGRTAPAHIMPDKSLKLEPVDEDIPIAGDVPSWGSGPQPDAPAEESGPSAKP